MSDNSNGIKLPDWGALADIDFNKLAPQYDDENDDLDYTPYNKKGRDITSSLFNNTGLLWIGGMAFGGLYGIGHGFQTRTNPSFKMTMNSIMNGWTKYGSKSANTLSVLGKNYLLRSLFIWFIL